MTNNYYQKWKERLRKEACEKYQDLSEEKDKRLKKAQGKYQNLLKKKKKKSFSIIVNIMIIFLRNKNEAS